MMKFVVTALVAILVSMPSQAKMTTMERAFTSHKLSVLKTQTAMKNVLVLATSRAQRHLLVTDNDDNDLPGPDELDLHVPYSRPRIVDNDNGDTISDYVAVRLAVARAKALQKYNEKWSNIV